MLRQNNTGGWFPASGVCALLLCFLLFSACKSSTATPPPAPPAQKVEVSDTLPEALTLRDPAKEEYWSTYHKSLGQAWERFLQSGRYRLAEPQDFTFSEAAKAAINKHKKWQYLVTEPYQFWCMGFVAIVVDTTKTGNNRFGLICFPEEGLENIVQKPYWLLVNEDLSKAILSRASCHHWVLEYADDGTEKGRYLNFDKRRNTYTFS